MNKEFVKRIVSLGLSAVMLTATVPFSTASAANVENAAALRAVSRIAKPATPKPAKIYNAISGVTFSWGKVSGASNYRVYRRSSSSKSWKYIANTKSTSYVDKTVKNYSGSGYYYTVRAENSAGLSGYTGGLYIKRISTPHIQGVNATKSGVTVYWTQAKNATAYRIYRKYGSGNWKYIKKVGKVGQYTDTAVKSKASSYSYTVRAEIGGKLSSYEVGAHSGSVATPVISYLNNDISGIKVAWNLICGAEKYRVYRKTSKTNWKLIATTYSTSYIDKSIKSYSGTTYYYTVRGIGKGSNLLSSYKSSAGIMRVDTPSMIKVTNSNDFIKVEWKKVNNAQKYRVYRKDGTDSWRYISEVSSGTTKYYDSKISANHTYTYTVRAIISGKYSAYESGLSVKHLVSNPVDSSSIIKDPIGFYQKAAQKEKNTAVQGFTKISYQTIEEIDLGAATRILMPVITSLMTSEDKARANAKPVTGNNAKSVFPASNFSRGSVKSAKAVKYGNDYKITIVFNDQSKLTKKDKDGLHTATCGDLLYVEDVTNTVNNNANVKKVVKNINNYKGVYRNFTIEAVMTKDGRFKSINMDGICDMSADLSIMLAGNIHGTGKIGFHVRYYNFK